MNHKSVFITDVVVAIFQILMEKVEIIHCVICPQVEDIAQA
jgi:hypothetical protein